MNLFNLREFLCWFKSMMDPAYMKKILPKCPVQDIDCHWKRYKKNELDYLLYLDFDNLHHYYIAFIHYRENQKNG